MAVLPPPPPPPRTVSKYKTEARHEPEAKIRPQYKATPLIVREYHRVKHFRDGGGLPSLGNWSLMERPKARLLRLGRLLEEVCIDNDLRTHVDRLYKEKSGCPFSDEVLTQTRDIIGHYCELRPEDRQRADEGQPFYLQLMSSVANKAGDPDSLYPLKVVAGVPLGVEEPIEATPGIWPKKKNEDPEPPGLPTNSDNYPSAVEHTQTIRETYIKERKLGMTKGPFKNRAEAARFCGIPLPKVCKGALGAREEKDKVRTIHDGTVNHVNPWIQKNIPEKTTAPRPADLLLASKSLEDIRIAFALLKTDVKKAHRRIKLAKKDWGYTAAQIDDEVWITHVARTVLPVHSGSGAAWRHCYSV